MFQRDCFLLGQQPPTFIEGVSTITIMARYVPTAPYLTLYRDAYFLGILPSILLNLLFFTHGIYIKPSPG